MRHTHSTDHPLCCEKLALTHSKQCTNLIPLLSGYSGLIETHKYFFLPVLKVIVSFGKFLFWT